MSPEELAAMDRTAVLGAPGLVGLPVSGKAPGRGEACLVRPVIIRGRAFDDGVNVVAIG